MVDAYRGVVDPDGKAPLELRRTFKNRGALRAAIERMIGWQPRRIILAHGRWYPDNAIAELRRPSDGHLPNRDSEGEPSDR
jgi:hypothetical protein